MSGRLQDKRAREEGRGHNDGGDRSNACFSRTLAFALTVTSGPSTLCSTSGRPLPTRELGGSPSLTTPERAASPPSVSFTLVSFLTP